MDQIKKPIYQSLLNAINAQSDAFNLSDILKPIFFEENEGRCLVLQNAIGYGVFFLKPEKFDWENEKSSQVKEFWNLVHFVKNLRKKGYIHALNGFERKNQIEVICSEYQKVIIEKDKIVFNEQGDYSIEPHVIYNLKGIQKYKGIVYKGDFYSAIVQNLTGVYVKSEKLDLLINPKKEIDENSEKKHSSKKGTDSSNSFSNWLILCAITLIFMLICISTIVELSHFRQTKESIAQINQDNDVIKLKVAEISLESHKLTDLNMQSSSVKSTENKVDKILFGIDISHYEGKIINEISLHDSLSFIICKATEGQYFVDPYFKSNWATLKEKKIIRGAYHFYLTNINPEIQAEHFLKTVNDFGKNDIPLIVDIEELSIPKETILDKKAINNDLLKFLSIVEFKTNKTPIIYTNSFFANEFFLDKKLSKYSLWIADYSMGKSPIIPELWKEKGYKIWQKTDHYSINSEYTDFDIFRGDVIDLIENFE